MLHARSGNNLSGVVEQFALYLYNLEERLRGVAVFDIRE